MTATTFAGADYWADYPESYRAEQVTLLAHWLRLGESGVIVGCSGSGKSNLAGFMASRPDVVARALPGQTTDYCLLHLDVNSLPAPTPANFYRGLLYALQAAIAAEPAIAAEAGSLLPRRTAAEDHLALYLALQRGHQLMTQRAGKKVIWLLDRFDEACQQLPASTLNSLRSLRDLCKGRLCYLLFTRFPLARLRPPTEFDEFHEIVVAHTCWVGPMSPRDATWIARQMAARHQTTISEAAIAQLLAVTGGLPAFMKAACSALANGQITLADPIQRWAEQLVTRPPFSHVAQDLWQDCTAAERAILAASANGEAITNLDGAAGTTLEQMGLLTACTDRTRRQLFSPIFGAFIRAQTHHQQGITFAAQSGVVLRNGQPLPETLTALEHRLLAYLLAHPNELCEKDAVIAHVWPEERFAQGVRDDSLAQLVKRLRDKIEGGSGTHVYIQTIRGRGLRFSQPPHS